MAHRPLISRLRRLAAQRAHLVRPDPQRDAVQCYDPAPRNLDLFETCGHTNTAPAHTYIAAPPAHMGPAMPA